MVVGAARRDASNSRNLPNGIGRQTRRPILPALALIAAAAEAAEPTAGVVGMTRLRRHYRRRARLIGDNSAPATPNLRAGRDRSRTPLPPEIEETGRDTRRR